MLRKNLLRLAPAVILALEALFLSQATGLCSNAERHWPEPVQKNWPEPAQVERKTPKAKKEINSLDEARKSWAEASGDKRYEWKKTEELNKKNWLDRGEAGEIEANALLENYLGKEARKSMGFDKDPIDYNGELTRAYFDACAGYIQENNLDMTEPADQLEFIKYAYEKLFADGITPFRATEDRPLPGFRTSEEAFRSKEFICREYAAILVEAFRQQDINAQPVCVTARHMQNGQHGFVRVGLLNGLDFDLDPHTYPDICLLLEPREIQK